MAGPMLPMTHGGGGGRIADEEEKKRRVNNVVRRLPRAPVAQKPDNAVRDQVGGQPIAGPAMPGQPVMAPTPQSFTGPMQASPNEQRQMETNRLLRSPNPMVSGPTQDAQNIRSRMTAVETGGLLGQPLTLPQANQMGFSDVGAPAGPGQVAAPFQAGGATAQNNSFGGQAFSQTNARALPVYRDPQGNIVRGLPQLPQQQAGTAVGAMLGPVVGGLAQQAMPSRATQGFEYIGTPARGEEPDAYVQRLNDIREMNMNRADDQRALKDARSDRSMLQRTGQSLMRRGDTEGGSAMLNRAADVQDPSVGLSRVRRERQQREAETAQTQGERQHELDMQRTRYQPDEAETEYKRALTDLHRARAQDYERRAEEAKKRLSESQKAKVEALVAELKESMKPLAPGEQRAEGVRSREEIEAELDALLDSDQGGDGQGGEAQGDGPYFIGDREIVVKDGKWVYKDTGEPV